MVRVRKGHPYCTRRETYRRLLARAWRKELQTVNDQRRYPTSTFRKTQRSSEPRANYRWALTKLRQTHPLAHPMTLVEGSAYLGGTFCIWKQTHISDTNPTIIPILTPKHIQLACLFPGTKHLVFWNTNPEFHETILQTLHAFLPTLKIRTWSVTAAVPRDMGERPLCAAYAVYLILKTHWTSEDSCLDPVIRHFYQTCTKEERETDLLNTWHAFLNDSTTS